MLTAIGRASVQRVLVRGSALAGRRTTTATPTFAKAVVAPALRTFTTSLRFRSPDASEKPATKTKKATTATKKTAAKPKAATKAAAAKKKPAAKKKAAAKPKAVKPKKVLTPEQKLKKEAKELRQEIKDLKVTALLSEPKKLPDTAWLVYSSANVVPGSPVGVQMPAVSRQFRSLSSSELQEYADTAARNKVANDASYRAWVESHEPIEIYNANVARRQLRRKTEGWGSFTRPSIRDERLPKGTQLAFGLYSKSRWASGELSGAVTEVAKQLSEEYKNLDPVEKKVYEDLAAADQVRYAKEMQAILGKEVKKPASASP
ncbi:hypothetical protein B0T11DRAFT_22522 [Plectosphaerella cucumerina]|uniref:HMG box domain-containing protein n=1 Tax=Plectosphaerella cucumerina TaxID=40658 RepID=A0A8K0TSE2_9PEZI|nr:hypothetical protein B0T11DRAFT_22522 [Plectosphaerella cucumerina]